MYTHTYIHTYIHYITLHYMTLHYITLHYITYIHIHTSIHIYIHMHVYTLYIYTFIITIIIIISIIIIIIALSHFDGVPWRAEAGVRQEEPRRAVLLNILVLTYYYQHISIKIVWLRHIINISLHYMILFD